MGELLKKVVEQLKNVWGKLNSRQKLIVAGVAIVLMGALFFAVSTSSDPTLVYLFERPLSQADYARITAQLQTYGKEFRTQDDRYILVRDEDLGAQIRMRLGQDQMLPADIKGWEIFDTEKWTTTDFERNVMKRRAIIGAMTRHLRMLEDVEDVQLTVSMPEDSLYIQSDEPWKASVTLVEKPFSELYKDKRKIQGIISLVANGIDKLSPENVIITDHRGNIISDFTADDSTDYLSRANQEYQMQERFRRDLENRIRAGLKPVLGDDRFDVSIKLELDFDQSTVERDEIIPIEITPNNPETPYNEREVALSVAASRKQTEEDFKGPTYIPEGPAGTENNIPPGLKEKINRFSHYNKNEIIENNEFSRQQTSIKSAPYRVRRIAVAAWIDGVWQKVYENGNLVITDHGSIKRNYFPVEEDVLRSIDDIIRRSIGYSAARGDQVVVRHLQFDRRREFELEDEEIRRRERIRKTLIAAVAALFVLFLGTLMYRAISREIARRKRIREEELALQQQRMREQALRAAEEEGVEVELSLEEKARLEMQENAINMARERPEDVAQLLRTWLMEE